MRTTAAGPDGVLTAGAIYSLDDEVATPLVSGGYAEALEAAEVKAVKKTVVKKTEDAGTKGTTQP